MKKLIDTDHPFFQPAWRRAAVVIFCGAWSAFEWWSGETLWGALTLAIALYCAWALFVTFEPMAPKEPSE